MKDACIGVIHRQVCKWASLVLSGELECRPRSFLARRLRVCQSGVKRDTPRTGHFSFSGHGWIRDTPGLTEMRVGIYKGGLLHTDIEPLFCTGGNKRIDDCFRFLSSFHHRCGAREFSHRRQRNSHESKLTNQRRNIRNGSAGRESL